MGSPMLLDTTKPWREMRDLRQYLLCEIASGMVQRAYTPIEIARLEAERDRLDELIVAYYAARELVGPDIDGGTHV